MQRYRLTIGKDSCDIRGFTNVQIQSAIDRVAMIGGGEVELSEGVFAMADSMHLRSGVTVRGQGEATVLRKNAMKSAKLAAFLGFGHYDIIVDKPEVFKLGDGIIVRDDRAGGFYTTVGTLIARDGDTWLTSRPHCHDYHSGNGGVVETLFPVISAYDVDNAAAENLAVDGNAAENPISLNGCRGGGAFAMRCKNLRLTGLVIRDCNTEGISFQTCDDAEIARCLVERCTGNGYHPGSGSNRFHIHDCIARNNGACGLFYCLRVRDSVLEDCIFEGNGSHGVSIGERDVRHINRRLAIRNNGGSGVFIRACPNPNCADDNLIEQCTIETNCAKEAKGLAAEVLVQGQTRGVRVIGNKIRRREGKPGIMITPEATTTECRDNEISPAGDGAVVDQRKERS